MRIYSSAQEFSPPAGSPLLVTMGIFDGVHLGHRKILAEMRRLAGQRNAEIVLLTFFPHPRMVLNPEDGAPEMITTMSEKEELLEQQGVDHLIIQPFNAEFAELSAREFVSQILHQQLGSTCLVVGHDHHFGKDREGSFQLLEEMSQNLGFELIKISGELIGDAAVSSTRIRKALKSGLLVDANRLLGKPFTLTGTVEEGDKLGRKMGFPTANIHIAEDYKLIPADGVYAIHIFDFADREKQYNGMLNIGMRPSVDGKERRVEAHIFDFSGNLYGHKLRLLLEKRIRNEKKFDSLDDLKQQLIKDEQQIRELLLG